MAHEFTARHVTSADHGREDFRCICGSTVGGVANLVGDDRDVYAAEFVGNDTTGLDQINGTNKGS